MPLYDKYEDYRADVDYIHLVELENQFNAMIANMRFNDPKWDPNAPKNRFAGGVLAPWGDPIYSDAVRYCMDAAVEAAKAQIQAHKPPMPEDEATTYRFPGTSPKGKYGIIDMKYAERWNGINACGQFRSPELAEYVAAIRGSEFYKRLDHNVTTAAYNHAYLTRAAKLCPDAEGRIVLNTRARAMELDPSVVQMDLLMQGIEYLHGLREDVPEDVADLFRRELQIDLNGELRQRLSPGEVTPATLNIVYDDFDDIMAQRIRSDPKNWKKAPEELANMAPSQQAVDHAVQPYATASAHRMLKYAFERSEKYGFDLRQFMIVNGKTLQEHFDEMGLPANMPPEEIQNRASALVTSALLAGKRVEAFLPDAEGKLSPQPTAIHAAGYSPAKSPQPVVLSSWERFCSKFGFYKEKVAQAEDYKQTMAARERVLLNWSAPRIENLGADLKGQFLPNEMQQLSNELAGKDTPYKNISRTSPASVCVCALLANKHKLEDILDPNKLQTEKEEVARTYIACARGNDYNWLGTALAEGTLILQQQLNQIFKATDLTDPVQRASALPILHAATYIGFDAYQDIALKGDAVIKQIYAENVIEAENDTARRQGKEYHVPEKDGERVAYGMGVLDRLRDAYAVCQALGNECVARAELTKPELSKPAAVNALAAMAVGDVALKALDRNKDLHECKLDETAQVALAARIQDQKEVKQAAEALSKSPAARDAMAKLIATSPMDEVLKVNTATVLAHPEQHGGPAQAADKIMRETQVTLGEGLKNALKAPTQARQMK